MAYSFDILRQELLSYLETHNISASALEKKAQLKTGTLRNIIYQNSKNPTADTLAKLSHTMGLSIDQLLKGKGASILVPETLSETEKDSFELLVQIMGFLVQHNTEKWPISDLLDLTKEIFNYCTTYKNGTFDDGYALHAYEQFSGKPVIDP